MKSKIALAISIALLSACSDRAPSEADFRSAIDQYLAASGAACFGLGKQFPAVLNAMELTHGVGRQFVALEGAGVLQSKAEGSGKTFAVASGAEQWFAEQTGKSVGLAVTRQQEGRLCAGTMQADQIQAITKTAKPGEFLVNFTFRLADRPAWATQPTVIDAVPKLAALVNGERLHTPRALRVLAAEGTLRVIDAQPH
ncbi:hypothetical protein KAK06_22050 [Ideonella sp. 4Y11]|uniref:Lipoprotein n=1 Tax=Ideonella aquatica TaxID=2824119 RepID=A0A940YPH6_9BURK|nr:hypothetical protein [Ideonella aquatica]MBQ0961639.1 hypothetical protein [Ideonella aquatica]